ncbi:MerR family transcriptional regulator [Salinibius halmophilus]|uniref:MerR family transcriptional regulator n=1 Tax=Salinibius halmophilus TaxID=1853216 RepID=UPI000E66D183|nr:MerR family transcriptional regulator [Salinibius halmophilus]
MRYSIQQLAEQLGISRRTLQYYDDIGLLKAKRQLDNQYRFYNQADMQVLQKILLLKQAGLSLQQIDGVLNDESLLPEMLMTQQSNLASKQQEISIQQQVVQQLISQTMEQVMANSIWQPLSEAEQQAYEQEAKQRWDAQLVEQSNNRWRAYSSYQQQQILAEGEEIYHALAKLVNGEHDTPEVLAVLQHWHEHLKNFYEPSQAMLLGLAELYMDDERFYKNLSKYDEKLPAFLAQAIPAYVASLNID